MSLGILFFLRRGAASEEEGQSGAVGGSGKSGMEGKLQLGCNYEGRKTKIKI